MLVRPSHIMDSGVNTATSCGSRIASNGGGQAGRPDPPAAPVLIDASPPPGAASRVRLENVASRSCPVNRIFRA